MGISTATRGSGRLKFVRLPEVIFVFGINAHAIASGDDPRRSPADISNSPFLTRRELNEIADADWFFNQDVDTGKQVRKRILQGQRHRQAADAQRCQNRVISTSNIAKQHQEADTEHKAVRQCSG